MKILVTGGAGFVGSHTVDQLLEKGHEVIIIDDLSAGNRDYINEKAKFYEMDINDDIDSVFQKEKPDVVVHMAAQIMLRTSFEDPIHDAKTNILGTINVLNASKKSNVKKFIYTSTGARFGEPKYLPLDEKHPTNPTSPYGISKLTAEKYVQMFGDIYGLNYLVFCFGNVYGPRDYVKSKRVIPVFCDSMLKKQPPTIFGSGEQTRDFIYVIDLAKFITESIDKDPTSKIFNLSNSKKISVNEIFNMLKNHSGFPKDASHIDEIKGEIKDIFLDTRLAREQLGWDPQTDFKKGLKESFDWFKNSQNR
jgi:UDP-glucose 4-epimerase